MNKVRFGVAGASGIAERRTMPAFAKAQHATLAAVCSRSLEQARKLAGKFHAPEAYDHLGAMLEAVDAVYVATPVHCHLADARKVLEAGKPLLLEKPLARTAAEAREILALARSRGVPAMEAYMMKFHPAHAAIRDALPSGKIGTVLSARARLGCWYPEIPGSWRQDKSLSGGGALMDLGSHLLDLLRWLLGPIRSLRAVCNTQIFKYPVEDSATVLLEFETGAHGIVEAYFSLPDQVGTGTLEILGTRGRVIAEGTIGQSGDGSVQWETFPAQAGYDAQQAGPAGEAAKQRILCPPCDLYAAQLDYFSQCVLAGDSPAINSLEDGVEILEWIGKAYAETTKGH